MSYPPITLNLLKSKKLFLKRDLKTYSDLFNNNHLKLSKTSAKTIAENFDIHFIEQFCMCLLELEDQFRYDMKREELKEYYREQYGKSYPFYPYSIDEENREIEKDKCLKLLNIFIELYTQPKKAQ